MGRTFTHRTIMAISVLLLAAPVLAGNLIINGDFETGDLSGWEVSGPSYYTFKFQSWGMPPAPCQIFSRKAPMTINEHYYDGDGIRNLRRIEVLEKIRPSQGKYAVGWTRSGWHHMGYQWVRQILDVAPGKYLMNASWDVCVYNTMEPQNLVAAGMVMVHLDEYVDYYTVDMTAYRHMWWDWDSLGGWSSHSVKGHLLETKTGKIEVRLQYLQSKITPHATKAPLPPPHYEFVAFDNFVFELTPVDADYEAPEEAQ